MLYAYPYLKSVEEDYGEHIKNRALLSYRSNKTAEELACAIAEDILEKNRFIKLKEQVESVLDKLSEVEKILVGARYFGKRKKLNSAFVGKNTGKYGEWSERKYFRVQSRLVDKLRCLFVGVGLTKERFEKDFAHTELFEKICRQLDSKRAEITRSERDWLRII